MILELHRQGVSISAIARQVGLDRKTVHKYIERGLEPPMYGKRDFRCMLGESLRVDRNGAIRLSQRGAAFEVSRCFGSERVRRS